MSKWLVAHIRHMTLFDVANTLAALVLFAVFMAGMIYTNDHKCSFGALLVRQVCSWEIK